MNKEHSFLIKENKEQVFGKGILIGRFFVEASGSMHDGNA